MKSAYGACALVRDAEGLYLAVNRRGKPEDLCLPGGKVELGEQPIHTAIRELEEETGLIATRALWVYGANNRWEEGSPLVEVFLIDVIRGPYRPEPGLTPQWVSKERLLDPRNTFAPYYKEMFETLPVSAPVRHLRALLEEE